VAERLIVAIGFFFLASIRPYYALFLLTALAAALPFAALAPRGGRLRTLGRAAAVLAISAAAALTGMRKDDRATLSRFSAITLAWTAGRASSAPDNHNDKAAAHAIALNQTVNAASGFQAHERSSLSAGAHSSGEQ